MSTTTTGNEPTLDVEYDPRPFAIDDWVRIKGGQGVYRVTGYAKDGSVSLYGGDKDPKGHRGSRNVMPDVLVASKSPYGDRP